MSSPAHMTSAMYDFPGNAGSTDCLVSYENYGKTGRYFIIDSNLYGVDFGHKRFLSFAW